MNISAWSIRKPLPAILAFILLTAAGLYAFRQLAISKFPDLTVPTVTVTVNLPGATPSTLETQVTRKIEDAVASIADIDDLTSTINEGVSTTVVAFDLGKNGNIAKDEVRDAVDRIRVDLPSEIEAPIVSLVNVAGDDMITDGSGANRLFGGDGSDGIISTLYSAEIAGGDALVGRGVRRGVDEPLREHQDHE